MKVTRRTNARAVSKALKLSLGDMKAVRNEGYKDGYARGLEDAAMRAIDTRSCTHDHAPGECEECHWVARIAAAIRKLGEDK